MTKREFFMLWAAKEDIRARAERLEALKSLAAAGAVNGQEVDLNRLARELEEKNRALAREVPQALALIETAGSLALRCALHMVCMEGCGWDEVAARLRRHGVWAGAVQLTVRDASLKTITRQTRLPMSTHLARDLADAAWRLEISVNDDKLEYELQ